MPKKRSPGEGGLFYDKKKNLYRGAVDVGFSPDGRRKQIWVTSRQQAAAREKLKDLQDEIREHGAPLDKSWTVARWATHWLETVCRPNLKPGPLSTYTSIAKTWIIPTIGKKKMMLVNPSDVRLVHRAIIDAGRSSSTALKAHVVMSSMFESARLDKAVRSNVVADVKPPTAAATNRDAFSTKDSLAILEKAAEHVDGTRWWIALLAAMRQGERLGATIDSLDFDNNLFAVQWSLTQAKFEHGCDGDCSRIRGGSCPKRKLIIADGLEYRQLEGRLCLVRPKSGKVRVFPMIPQLADALKRYMEATKGVPNPHGLIWRNADGSPIIDKQDNKAWRELLFNVGLITEEQNQEPKDRLEGTPDVPTTHWARHTTVTVLMELGVDAQIIGEIVGHSSIDTTRRYQHVSSEAARQALDKLGSHFQNAIGAK